MSLTWARQVVSKSEEPIPEEDYRDLKRIHPQLRFRLGAMKGGTEISVVFAKASPAISLASRSSLQHLSHLDCLAHVWGNPTFAILLLKNVLTTVRIQPLFSKVPVAHVQMGALSARYFSLQRP